MGSKSSSSSPSPIFFLVSAVEGVLTLRFWGVYNAVLSMGSF